MSYLKHFPKPLLGDLIEGRWLPMVGAGLSRNAILPHGSQMPLWSDLGDAVAGDLADFTHDGPLDALSAYEHEYGRPKLVEAISDLLFVQEAQPGPVHRAFCSIPFDVVCTTNFDFLIERQYELTPRPCTPILDEDQLSVRLRSSSVALLKIHGDLNHPTRLVVTEEDYDGFLNRYPLMATHLSNHLITRTAVLIGYSLDDPDFRQIWQVIGDRLGRLRRTAYAILVGATSSQVARFQRRGVKVVNLPGTKQNYGTVLAAALQELGDYWRRHVMETSHITEEKALRELSLPADSPTRLCFFAVPLSVLPYYRERVFPIARDLGLVPVTADEVISPGDNYFAKLDALMARSSVVIVDVSSDFTLAELRMALARPLKGQLLVISPEIARLPVDVLQYQIIQRPNLTDLDESEFEEILAGHLATVAEDLRPTLTTEAYRLLEAKEYRAAVIAAISSLEGFLRRRLEPETAVSSRPISIRQMLEHAARQGLLGTYEVRQVLPWLRIRNEVVHGDAPVTRAKAREVVSGVQDIMHQTEN